MACLQEDESVVDVCIVGAGPSGATCAYHLAKAGHRCVLHARSCERKRLTHSLLHCVR
jgi:flavin-dependent dehydrogenase